METKSAPAAGVALQELDLEIERLTRVKAQKKAAEDLESAGVAKIKALMARLKLPRRTTACGFEAVLTELRRRLWNVDSLREHLDPVRFKALCPETPQAKELGELLKADPILKPLLEKCYRLEADELGTLPTSLTVTAPDIPTPKDKPINLLNQRQPAAGKKRRA